MLIDKVSAIDTRALMEASLKNLNDQKDFKIKGLSLTHAELPALKDAHLSPQKLL